MRTASDSPPARPRKNPSTYTPAPLDAGAGSPPTTFFLRSEREMQRTMTSPTADSSPEETLPTTNSLEHSSFGVQSLNDALDEASGRTSPSQRAKAEGRAMETLSLSAGRRRNPVHPKIAAAAHRILTSENASSRTSSLSSVNRPCSSTSPLRGHLRSASRTSRNQSFTSLHLNHRNLGSSTPRSASVRSLALSDDDGSMLDDSGSQALHSSSDEEDEIGDNLSTTPDLAQARAESIATSMPQLVMPSLSMPQRRPFTARGNAMGRLKILVMGPAQVGKTSLIRSIMQSCQDIVHVDPCTIAPTITSQSWPSDTRNEQQHFSHTENIIEINASSKAYPRWWSETDTSRGLKRRWSTGGAILDRNICFVDTPGWESSGFEHEHMQMVVDDIIAYMEEALRRNTCLGQLDDSEVLASLTSGGGVQVDAILYVLRPTCMHISPTEMGVLRRLSSLTNIIPVIGKSDTCSEDEILDAKAGLRAALISAGVSFCTFQALQNDDPPDVNTRDKTPIPPYVVSSALEDDSDVMDASLLMSPEYRRSLVPSELTALTQQLLEPDNISWLRHCAVKKFLTWRREHHAVSLQPHKNELRALSLDRQWRPSEDDLCSIDSIQADWSMVSRIGESDRSRHDYRRHIDMSHGSSPLHIAGWAQDLQRAMDAERRRLLQHGNSNQVVLHRDQNGSDTSKKIRHKEHGETRSAARARNMSYNQDPLGVLGLVEAWSKRGWTTLRVVGSCSIFATVAVWVMRNWSEVAESIGLRSEVRHQIPGYAHLGLQDEWKGSFWG